MSRFNPRSREGNDNEHLSGQHICGGFNPRSREGNDSIASLHSSSVAVSIHVPARGTTTCCRQERFEGGFQSTFPRGERRKKEFYYTRCKCFNPRSREGNDSASMVPATIKSAFQSTFPRGERPTKILVANTSAAVSIHVPARGTT